jgi:hypothetical protein
MFGLMNLKLLVFVGCCLLLRSFSGYSQYVVQFTVVQPLLLDCNAGQSQVVNPGSVLQLGGQPAAWGGSPPYAFAWSPSYGLNDPTLPNPTLTADSAITYTLNVTDDQGCTASSAVEILLSTGVEKITAPQEEFAIFPNPLQDNRLIIHRTGSITGGRWMVSISNITGSEVYRGNFDGYQASVEIPFSGNNGGIYILTIGTERVYRFKLVVQ